MFWYLLFAHFVADYPLQTNWIARNKGRIGVLALHAAIHLVSMLVLLAESALQLWPYLLALTAVHFCIDYGKNLLRKARPQWVIWPYLFDQVLHYLAIGALTAWITSNGVLFTLPFHPSVVIYATGYIIVTIAWFISERLLTAHQPAYQKQVIEQFWSRMITRAAMLTIFLLLGNGLFLIAPIAGIRIPLPYTECSTRRRAIATDIAVAFGTALLIFAALLSRRN